MYGNTILADTTLVVPPNQGQYFTLCNVALDPRSQQALIFAKIGASQILISQFDRSNGHIASTNLNIQFQVNKPAQLKVCFGNLHIIGNFKPQQSFKRPIPNISHASQIINEVNSKKQQQMQIESSAPLRRSSRNRTPATNKVSEGNSASGRRKKDSGLKDMAAYFKLNQKDLQEEDEDDDQEAFDKQQLQKDSSSSSSSSQSSNSQHKQRPENKENSLNKIEQEQNDEVRKRRKLETNSDKNITNFSKPTKNPYD